MHVHAKVPKVLVIGCRFNVNDYWISSIFEYCNYIQLIAASVSQRNLHGGGWPILSQKQLLGGLGSELCKRGMRHGQHAGALTDFHCQVLVKCGISWNNMEYQSFGTVPKGARYRQMGCAMLTMVLGCFRLLVGTCCTSIIDVA